MALQWIDPAMIARILKGGHWAETPPPDRRMNSRRPVSRA